MGYFFKLYLSDVFISLDDVQYSRKSYTKRTAIRKRYDSDEFRYLNAPIIKPEYQCRIDEVYLQKRPDTEKLCKRLYMAYKGAPYLDVYYDLFAKMIQWADQFEKLSEFNSYITQSILALLDKKIEYKKASDFNDGQSGFQHLAALIEQSGATVYLSGSGVAREINERSFFEESGIKLVYVDFRDILIKNPYEQVQGEIFLPGLSIFDAFMNIGRKGVKEFFESYKSQLLAE
jgi:hypothetical protein